MKKFEILEHKADLKIRAYGKSQKEVFSNMLYGMMEVMGPEIRKPEEKIIRTVRVKSFDLSSLLVDFLNEVLYQTQVNKETYVGVNFQELTEKELKAAITGKKVKRFEEDVKAATYNNLEVKNENGGWQATVLFDV